MWKRICAYVLGIPLAFVGVLYAYSWYSLRATRLEAQKFLQEVQARENALDSLGDVKLDPTNATLSKLEVNLHQPDRVLAGANNTTKIGWACGGTECEVWAFFQQPLGPQLDPNMVPFGLFAKDHLLTKRLHEISIGGIHLGESIAEMKDYCAKRGYGRETAYHRMTWDKDWTFIWAETSGKVSFLMFMNERRLKNLESGATTHVDE